MQWMVNRLFRAIIGLFLFTPWLWRAYQTYKVASKMPPPSIYEAGMMAAGAVLLLTLAWTERWASKLAHLYNSVKGLKTVLEVSGPHVLQNHPAIKRWRMTVRNEGHATAINVQMRLRNIDPRPKYRPWEADYPYPVQLVGTIGNPQFSCRINQNDDAAFEIVSGWPNNGDFYTRGLDTKTTHDNPIRIENDERWELKYEVIAENADSVGFSLEMSVDAASRAVVVQRKMDEKE
jgi:hypothetical protein